MPRFVEPLEARLFLSADKATLGLDAAGILHASAIVKADLKAVAPAIAAANKTIQSDLKSLTTSSNKSTIAKQIANLKRDEGKLIATLSKDAAAVTSGGLVASAHGLADGVHVLALKKPDAALQTKLAQDITKLDTISSTTTTWTVLTTLDSTGNAGQPGGLVENDLGALATDYPSIGGDVAATLTAVGGKINTLDTDAQTFAQTAIGKLATDLGNGTIITGIPDIKGHYTGSAAITGGPDNGSASSLVFDITTEGSDGSFSGTGTTNENGKVHAATISGTVAANGTFHSTLIHTSNGTVVTLTGTVSGNTISGTFNDAGSGNTGTFTITK